MAATRKRAPSVQCVRDKPGGVVGSGSRLPHGPVDARDVGAEPAREACGAAALGAQHLPRQHSGSDEIFGLEPSGLDENPTVSLAREHALEDPGQAI